MNTLRTKSQTMRICATMMVMILCVGASLFLSSPFRVAHAGSDTIIAAFTNAGQKSYDMIKSIVLPLAVIAFSIGGISLFFGGKNGAEKARVWCLSACVGVLIVFLAPLAIKSLGSWFGGEIISIDDVVSAVDSAG